MMNNTLIEIFCEYYNENYIMNVFSLIMSIILLFFYFCVKFFWFLFQKENEQVDN